MLNQQRLSTELRQAKKIGIQEDKNNRASTYLRQTIQRTDYKNLRLLIVVSWCWQQNMEIDWEVKTYSWVRQIQDTTFHEYRRLIIISCEVGKCSQKQKIQYKILIQVILLIYKKNIRLYSDMCQNEWKGKINCYC